MKEMLKKDYCMEPINIYDNPLTDDLRKEFNELYAKLVNLNFKERTKRSEEVSNLQNKIIANKNQNYIEVLKNIYEKPHLYSSVTIMFILDKETEDCLYKLHQLLIKNERNF